MEHQDWKTVVLRKPKTPPKNSGGGGPKPPVEGDEFKIPKVGHSLKIAIMQARTARKMSQKDLAQALKVPVDLVNKYESGKVVPNNAFIVKIEKVLGTKLPRITKKK